MIDYFDLSGASRAELEFTAEALYAWVRPWAYVWTLGAPCTDFGRRCN